MRTTEILLAAAGLITSVTSHATFQQLWVNGADKGSSCARLPATNSPVTSVNTNDLRCNANPGKAASKCSIPAGASITVEMHQQNGQRDCSQEGIGGNHFGPVMVYLSKVSDASTDTGSGKWFKIFELGYNAATKVWGNEGLNKGCGKQALKIPSNIAPGDYLLRAETIALHAAGQAGGAQFYMTCYQITVTGGGSANPSGVSFPGAYNAADPGITINIYQNLASYTIPGPAVYSG